jgi:hypothetical protein
MKRRFPSSKKHAWLQPSGHRAAKKRAGFGRALSIESLEGRLMMAADFGDAPAPFPVTLAENGARHEAVGPQLGATRDAEADGAHSANADGDGADEDGVTFGTLQVGKSGTITVNVQNAAAGAKLDAWIDFNGDGNWGDAGEQIADSKAVANGDQVITVAVPSDAIPSKVFARFRLSTAGGLSPKGAAADGEVEDYAVTLAPPTTASGQFDAGKDVQTGLTAIQTVVAGDIDGDGKIDLVSAAYGADRISFHRNNGATWQNFIIDSTADGARDVALADVNGDGRLDVIAASQLDTSVTWYDFGGINGSTATFTPHVVSSTVSQAGSVAAADIDGDGDMDLVSAGNNRVTWFENDGSATFTAHLLPISGTSLSSVAVANLDNDGDLDILFTGTGATNYKIGWYENNGSQLFTAHSISSTAAGAARAIASDLDHDGDIDVVAASAGDNTIAWYENGGNKSFTSHTLSTTSMGAADVFAADVNGDGATDIVASSATDSRVVLFQNNGSQSFTERVVSSSATGVHGAVAADLNGDGDLDIAIAQSGNARVRVFQNQNTATGNYVADAVIDGADFMLWQRTLGATASPAGSGADGDANGTVGANDLALWRGGFGFHFPPGSSANASADAASAAVPLMTAALMAEPASSPDETAQAAAVQFDLVTKAATTVALDQAVAQSPTSTRPEYRPATMSSGPTSLELLDELFASWSAFG